MPIYEYECRKCGDQFDVIQSFSDKPLRKCRKCGGRLTKLVSECSFHLKGSGWYVTDYSGKTPSKAKKKKESKKSDSSTCAKSSKSDNE
ncbi:MAG: zinc ribbon domain-containing protein [Deltaproteobacteria bacterium]|nr:MAG: zinc ribbon domain-containing protein [Deltaproteobacteria bacterium]